jgi:DNA-binding response OmpR family regulator
MVILDWMMPGLDGLELCRRIRKLNRGPYIYVLLLTAKDGKEDVVAGLEAGADDYLTKPFDVNELHARVRVGKRCWNCRMR